MPCESVQPSERLITLRALVLLVGVMHQNVLSEIAQLGIRFAADSALERPELNGLMDCLVVPTQFDDQAKCLVTRLALVFELNGRSHLRRVEVRRL
jgi:hypothetical protein